MVRFFCLAVLAASFAGGNLLAASLFVSDVFPDGPDGSGKSGELSGKDTTATKGFTSPWQGAVSALISFDSAGNLAFSPLKNSGGSVAMNDASENVSRLNYRRLEVPEESAKWFAALIRVSPAALESKASRSVGYLAEVPKVTGTAALNQIWPHDFDARIPGFAWGLEGKRLVLFRTHLGEAESLILLPEAKPDQTYLLLGKLDGGRLQVWVRTDLPADEKALGAPTAEMTDLEFTPALVAFIAQMPAGSKGGDNLVWFDALRIGPSLKSVSPKN